MCVQHIILSNPELFKVKYTKKKSGTQSLSLSRAEHASEQAVSASFCGSYALVIACFALCHTSFVFPRGGTVILGMFIAHRWLPFRGGGTYGKQHSLCSTLVGERPHAGRAQGKVLYVHNYPNPSFGLSVEVCCSIIGT